MSARSTRWAYIELYGHPYGYCADPVQYWTAGYPGAFGIRRVADKRHSGWRGARSLLASIPVVILSIGGALLIGEKLSYYDKRFSLALMATLSIAMLIAVILRTARHLCQLDKSRGNAQAELAALNASLELRVFERASALEAVVHGHEAGDLAIIAAAQVLKAAFRASDIVARIGGDEFVVLAADAGESSDALSACVQALVDEFNGSELCRYPIGLSIGAVRCSPKELKPLGELLASADAAMYTNKQDRRQQTLHCDECAIHVPPMHVGRPLESPSVL